MPISVARTAYTHSRHGDRDTLEQRFEFSGGEASAGAITDVLLTAPLTGAGSVFGNRSGTEREGTERSRSLRGFSPVPGFKFDVDLSFQGEGVFAVRFTQPDRNVPYLQGDVMWTVADRPGGATFDEQVNTEAALEVVSEPLGGSSPSLRRWLFFRVGHKAVMAGAARNIAELVDERH
jgi:hypothetical protein